MVQITVTNDIHYDLADIGGIVGSQPYKKQIKVDTLSDWKLTEKLNGLKVFTFSVKNDELEKANIFVERDIYVPLLTPFKGIITSKEPGKEKVDFVAHEDAWHFSRRKFKCHDKARLKYTNEGWYDKLWLRRRQLSIPEVFTKHIKDPYLNVPVLVHITDVELKHHARVDGFDILFTIFENDESIKLKHKIEKYTPSTGELIAWVELPEIRDSTIKFQMYFDNPEATDQGSTTTFDNFGYGGVWLLEGDALDETSNNNDGTINLAVYNATVGPFGNGSYDFDGVAGDISCGSGASLDNVFRGSIYERDNHVPRIDTITIPANTVYATELQDLIPGDFITEIGLEVTVATGNIRLKLYDDVNGRPTNLLSQSGSIAAATGVTVHYVPKTEVPENGKVWVAVESSVTNTFRGGSGPVGTVAHTFGTGPDPFGTPVTPGAGSADITTTNEIHGWSKSDISITANRIHGTRIRLTNLDWDITEIGWIPAPTITGNVRLAIYDNAMTTSVEHPGTLLAETASTATGASGVIQMIRNRR
jgi:hypothetical protein